MHHYARKAAGFVCESRKAESGLLNHFGEQRVDMSRSHERERCTHECARTGLVAASPVHDKPIYDKISAA